MKFQNTKIIATVGPALNTRKKLLDLAKAGVDVFRLNFSHGTHQDHLNVIEQIQWINQEYNLHIGILADLQGPKIRVGKIKNDGIPIKPGDIITFTNLKVGVGTKNGIYMSYKQFPQDVKVGDKVLVDDGKIELSVIDTNSINEVKLKVLFGSRLNSNKGVNLPDTSISLPSITAKDLNDLEFILKHEINWIALSFVRTAKDLKDLKKIIKKKGHPAKIIAKIEKPEAISNIDKIIAKTDAVMVARGDLGVEMPMEQLPLIQKTIINKCHVEAKPVIVATQMMESMIHNLSPTRAEITDVANAVLDGTDAVMLSGETSVGDHPTAVVNTMVKIIQETENNYVYRDKKIKPSRKSKTFYSDVICYQAVKTAEETGAKALIGMTISGYTAFRMSSYRPKSEIFIFSERPYMLATLNLVWGVRGFYYDKFSTTDETVNDVVEILKEFEILHPGDFVVNTGSMPLHSRGRTNMLKLTLVE